MDAIALLRGRLAFIVGALAPGLARSRMDAVGGLRVSVDGFFDGGPVFGGCFEDDGLSGDLSLGFVRDLGPSAELGLEDGVVDRAGGSSVDGILT